MIPLTPLPQQTLQLVDSMIDFGLLVEYDSSKMTQVAEGPMGVVVCSDCRQKKDIDSHWEGLLNDVTPELFLHEFKFHGAPFLSARSKYTDRDCNENILLLKHIKFAITKGLIGSKVVFLNHGPCGAANENNLSLMDTCELTISGRSQISALIAKPHVDFSVGLHIDYRTTEQAAKDRRSRHLDISKWEDFKKHVGYVPHADLMSRSASA